MPATPIFRNAYAHAVMTLGLSSDRISDSPFYSEHGEYGQVGLGGTSKPVQGWRCSSRGSAECPAGAPSAAETLAQPANTAHHSLHKQQRKPAVKLTLGPYCSRKHSDMDKHRNHERVFCRPHSLLLLNGESRLLLYCALKLRCYKRCCQ